MRAVTLGAMLVVGDGLPASAAAQVRSHARAFVQDLDRGGRRANLHQLVHQVVGHAVEVGIEGHVIVDVDAGARPFAQIERFGGQWLQRGFVDGFPHAGPSAVLLGEQRRPQLTCGAGSGRAMATRDSDSVVGRWKGGRLGSVRIIRPYSEIGAVVFRPKQIIQGDETMQEGYGPLVKEIVKFFQTGTPPVAPEETLEIMSFMDSAQHSKAAGGQPVRLR